VEPLLETYKPSNLADRNTQEEEEKEQRHEISAQPLSLDADKKLN